MPQATSVNMSTARQLHKHCTSVWMQVSKAPIIIALSRVLIVVWQALLPFLKKLFGQTLARVPAVPSLRVVDARCNRVKVEITCPATSIFNEDEYEVQYACKPDDPGTEASWSALPWNQYSHRVIAPLSSNTRYILRARSRNAKGCSSWGLSVPVMTLIEPVSGGAACDRYTWTQNGIEVSTRVDVPSEVKAKHVSVSVRPEFLAISYTLEGKNVKVVEGVLPHRVRLLSPDGGSYWEIDREGKHTAIVVVLEKEKPAQTIKWGFWRSMFVGQPEIDTHAILSDPYVKPTQPSPGMSGAPGLDMKTVARSEYEALRRRLGHSAPQI